MIKIVRNPNILTGKPTIEGTRISVELILNLIEHGQTIPEIMAEYNLSDEQVKSAIAFASQKIKEDHSAQRIFTHEISSGRKHR